MAQEAREPVRSEVVSSSVQEDKGSQSGWAFQSHTSSSSLFSHNPARVLISLRAWAKFLSMVRQVPSHL